MNCNLIPEREDWIITDRKPTICPHCGPREVRKAVLAFFLFTSISISKYECVYRL